ncbi:hypothetical protein [Sunxiuqinia elliptica]|uniref:Preprotein translocase subunit SecB n=1 Tax=Sunxiuqinia elliptica TaxID=655355 RepID=A0A4R6H5U3_9BACT|nr:hypothetical protein [Sunxiuqinia elliptica]TDO03148.1 hypothetical protein DET52_10388 [Sunxiuqinia elliptica]TDO59345.1 hypothetical protein DET65_2631 [Sunxiuqinia elliptica]
MKEDQKQFEIGYRIIKIHSVKFNFEDYNEDIIDELFRAEDALGLYINTSLKIDKENSIITIDIATKLVNNNDDKTIISHTGRTSYHVKGLDKVYDIEPDSFDLPDDFTIQLYSLAYSHSRALLSTELSPTNYRDKYFLPVINPSQFIKKDKSK